MGNEHNKKIVYNKSKLLIYCLLFAALFLLVRETTIYTGLTHDNSYSDKEKCVVLDAGHGGIDPGKVGINGALEKDINLAVTKKVKTYLELEGVHVIMTRSDDNGLYLDTDTNKKVSDMKKRLEIINSSHPALAVSIHQNSYPEESVSGIQVFYYRDSLQGEKAANIMQEQLIDSLKPSKIREAKQNSSYYLLKKTSHPIIIVECGFLSNSQEAGFLISDEYQDKMAWAIHLGIMKYINSLNL